MPRIGSQARHRNNALHHPLGSSAFSASLQLFQRLKVFTTDFAEKFAENAARSLAVENYSLFSQSTDH
jgi:hypothetical protein